MDTEPSDSELMNAYVGGDERAFSVLFGRYSPKLTSFLRYRLSGRKKHLAEDVYQKTWLKVHAGRKTFDQNQKFSTWFYTVALNTLRDEIGSLYEKSSHDEADETIEDRRPSSEEQYFSKETFRQIETLFKYLTDSQKTALLLSDQEDLNSKEIADIMKISDSSARQLVSRARKVIRTRFKHDAEKVSNRE